MPQIDPAQLQARFDAFRAAHPFPTNPGFPFPGGGDGYRPPDNIPSPISGDNTGPRPPFPGGGGTFPGGGFTGGNFPGGGRSDMAPTVRPTGGMRPRTFSPITAASGSGANPVRNKTSSNQ